MNLHTNQIIEAFPDECENLVPKLIRECKCEIKPYTKEIKNMRKRGFDRPTEMLLSAMIKNRLRPELYQEKLRRLEAIQFTLHPPKGGYLTPAMIEEAKAVPLLSLYEFEKVRTSYGRFSCCCPFHSEKTPSFFVYATNTYHCFGCDVSGDTIQFIMTMHDMKFKEAVKYLITN